MRMVWLYAKARGGPQCVAWLLLLGALALLLARVEKTQTMPAHRETLVIWMAVLSLASAFSLGATTVPSGGAIERLSVQPLWLLRGLCTIGPLCAATAPWSVLRQILDSDQAAIYGRNVLGFAGLSLLAAVSLGPAMHWIAPLCVAIASFLVPRAATHLGWAEILLGWPLKPGGDTGALVTALGLLIIGWTVYTVVGADHIGRT